jgi:antirestriction protein ArdC
MRTDVYQRITGKIVQSLEQGVRPWMQPWSAGADGTRIVRPLRFNGLPYNGINVLMLWSAAEEKGYSAPIWMTFKQALELDAHVRKGEQGSLVVYADKITRTETDTTTGEQAERTTPFMKGYTVFNVEQIDGLPERFCAKPEPKGEPVKRIEHADAFFEATRASIVHGGSRACYVRLTSPHEMREYVGGRPEDGTENFLDKTENKIEANTPHLGKRALVRTGLTPHNLPADCSNDRADECSTWTNSSKAAISIAK